MTKVDVERHTIAAELTAGGVTDVTLDPATLPPFVLVAPPSGVQGYRTGTHQVAYTIKIVATPPGNLAAWEWLSGQLDAVLDNQRWDTFTSGTEPLGDRDCPAYFVTVVRDFETC